MKNPLYVNPKTTCLAKALFIFALAISTCRCTTTDGNEHAEDDVSTKEKKVLDAQIDVVVNYLNQAQPAKAHAELRAMMFKNPDDPRLLNLMGLANLVLKQSRKAEEYFRLALEQKYDHAYALNQASALIDLKQYAKR